MKNKNLNNIMKKIAELNAKAKKFGIFTDNRELAECPKCGLMEDIGIDGRLFTAFKSTPRENAGLEFKESGKKGNRFYCPNCGKVIILKETDLL